MSHVSGLRKIYFFYQRLIKWILLPRARQTTSFFDPLYLYYCIFVVLYIFIRKIEPSI